MARRKPDAEIVDALRRVTDLDRGVVNDIASVGQLVTIPARWSVIHENTPADRAYILVEGEAEVRRDKTTIATLGPGDVFGEIALVDRRLRSASVVANTPLKAVHLTDESFAELLQRDPSFADRLRDLASSRQAGDADPA
ncbi:cyclic nucleotide-binding domain-containing protein [Solicola sp. PLA-1-18]|jgi:CRP-like cAMP-binding protein|uniref:cyclic nucleotide-binding domain-containing protein n=1 Tax=Solicola sp. PLA-1-18 TaxID=3380532 RepID=UPI003B80820A